MCHESLFPWAVVVYVPGPYWFSPPPAGPFAGQAWRAHKFAAGFRDWCRAAVIDINGDGRPEHPIESRLIFAHTLQAWRDARTGVVNVLVGEMNQGGWGSPYNFDARLLKYVFTDGGKSMRRELLYQGEGTHEGRLADLDGDGVPEIVGHSGQVVNTKYPDCIGWVQVFKQRAGQPLPFQTYHHEFIDQEKPATGTDILWTDVDGDGLPDVVCGSWWYKSPSWQRRSIPGVAQVLNAFDIDKDGRKELIAIKGKPGAKAFYAALSSEFCRLKPVEPLPDSWEKHRIGTGSGDWPHGTAIAPLLPGGRLALVAGYHNRTHPEIFEAPETCASPWTRRVLAEIPYGEEMVACDLDGDGRLDVVAGPYWPENMGDGKFTPHLLAEGYDKVARVAVADINGDGRPDVVVAEENVSWSAKRGYYARVAWLENGHVVSLYDCHYTITAARG